MGFRDICFCKAIEFETFIPISMQLWQNKLILGVMERMPWVERNFCFEIPPEWMVNVLERLEGTVPRLLDLCSGLDEAICVHRLENQWSINQHIGHLGDLEQLHESRIEDFLSRKPVLRASDMSNKQTEDSDHQSKTQLELIRNFKMERHRLVDRLRSLDDTTSMFSSLHPRLNKPMKPVDMAFFVAEHDDHHLASIRLMINQYKHHGQI